MVSSHSRYSKYHSYFFLPRDSYAWCVHTYEPALWKLSEENHKFQTSLIYIVRQSLNKSIKQIRKKEIKGGRKEERKGL